MPLHYGITDFNTGMSAMLSTMYIFFAIVQLSLSLHLVAYVAATNVYGDSFMLAKIVICGPVA